MPIKHIDHVTYVCASADESSFTARWAMLGFREHVRVQTSRYPATHIALVSGLAPEYPWATMTGLSISPDRESPINQFVRRYGAGQQHSAYNIDRCEDMDELYRRLVASGWNFMTGVLTYRAESGAGLRQLFTAPDVPYGPFVELVQRLPGPSGQAYDGFDPSNIDDLYQAYADYSAHLEFRKSGS